MATQPASPARVTAPPPLAPERVVTWPHRTVRTLPNGLKVVLVESHSIPKVSMELLFRSGNAVVAGTRPGLAAMTAEVVRTGTASRSEQRIEEDLRRMGADLGTSSGADSSAISIAGLAEFAGPLLDLVNDVARNAVFPVEAFERERRKRVEELRIERTTPGFLAGERLRRVLFGQHPYATVAPSEDVVQSYRREELSAYYQEHYRPDNALLIAVGDFATDSFFDMVSRILGSWPTGEGSNLAPAALLKHVGRSVHLVHLPGAVQAQILVGNMAITRLHPDWLRLAVANSIYGGAFHSRLVMNIREQKGYTYSPRSGVNALREHGYFSVSAAVRNDVVAATLTEILYELDRMRALPVGADELVDTQNYLSGVFALGLGTQDGILGQLATVYLHGLPEDYVETYRQRVRAVTAEEVLAATRRYFDSANVQIVVVGDREQIEEQAALFGPVEFFDTQGKPM